ncbi:MAG: dTMP kinase [Candidatus Cryptobacteroides sp.]
MLIVIEGLDGAGKSTQVSMLRKYLEERCGEVEYIHFPRYDAPVYGDLIGRFLRGDFGDIGEVHPQLVALLYAEDRRDAVPAMRAALDSGKCILLDRYVYSNIAYQCAKLSNPEEASALRKWIFETEYGAFGLPVPDLNLFLDVPVSFVEKKLSSSRQGDDREYLAGGSDIHEADIAFQKKVRGVYLDQCREDPDFERIDCSGDDGGMLPPEVIFGRIRAAIDNTLTNE